MERSSDHGDLATALAEARPTPREDFARRLDERVAAGFPRRSRSNGPPVSALADRLRLSPQRLLLSGAATALVAIAIVTVVIASDDSGSLPSQIALDRPSPRRSGRIQDSQAPPK